MADSLASQSILDDNEYFQKSYGVLFGRMRQQELGYEDWVAGVVRKIRPKVLKCVDESTKGTLRALAVGSGDGKWEDFILSHLKSEFAQVLQSVVEPNKYLLELHKTNTLQNDWQNVTYDWNHQTAEKFIENFKKTGKETKYHLITTFHSMYYVTNPAETFDFLYDQLEEGGILLVNMCAESSVTARVTSVVPRHLSRIVSDSSRFALDYFDSKGIAYEFSPCRINLDVSGCLSDDGKVSDEVALLLDFLAHVKDFCTTPREVQDRVFSVIRDMLGSSDNQEVDITCDILVVQRVK